MTDYAQCSIDKLHDTFSYWGVSDDFGDPLRNYLLYAYAPGSFMSGLLANDAKAMIGSSHPSNTVTEMKKVFGWLLDHAPAESWGNEKKVNAWLQKSYRSRRKILEKHQLVYSPHEETRITLSE